MKKDYKILVAVLMTGGGILLARYFVRQYRMLRNVCVSNVNFNWAAELVQLAVDAADGNGFSLNTLDAPFQLELSNSSDIPVTVKDINLSVFLEGQKIGSIMDQQPTTIDKNSSVTLQLNLDIDEDVIESALLGTAQATLFEGIYSILSGQELPTTQIEVSGIIDVKASFYESFKIRYRLLRTPSQLIEEQSGNCETINA